MATPSPGSAHSVLRTEPRFCRKWGRNTTDSDCSGWAQFQPDGEVLTAGDDSADGHGLHVYYWREDTDATDEFSVDGGSGTTEKKNLSIPEGTSVAFYACLHDSGGDQDSSDWIYDVA